MDDDKSKYKFIGCFALLCTVVVIGLISVALIEALTWIVCLGFGFTWTLQLGAAVWAVIVFLFILSKVLL